MLSNIKKELLNNPDKLEEVLERFEFYNIVKHSNYISFGRSENSSKKSVVIWLENNDYLCVKDYARNTNADIFNYICMQRGVEFSDVLATIKSILGIDDYYDYFGKVKTGIFGGFYEKIRSRKINKLKTYDESILDKYENYGNLRFLKDNISLNTQKQFNIMYDVESQGIVIPIRNQIGQIMGIKTRCNWDVQDGEQKYYYLLPCSMSKTLYGYSQNYNYLVNNVTYVFEAEKSVLQCYSYGIRNCVSMGSGSISNEQIKMLFELNPKKIIFLHDVGYEIESILRNVNKVKEYSIFSNIEIGYWDFFGKNYEDKVSPSDLGKETLEYVIQNEIKFIGDEENEKEL